MILFKKTTANIYLYSLKNDDTHIPNQQLCTTFVHSFFSFESYDVTIIPNLFSFVNMVFLIFYPPLCKKTI